MGPLSPLISSSASALTNISDWSLLGVSHPTASDYFVRAYWAGDNTRFVRQGPVFPIYGQLFFLPSPSPAHGRKL